MNHYLLYDAGCSRCATLAANIETVAAGRLGLKDMRDTELNALLDQHAPSRKWEPMVLETDGDRVRVYSGLAMRTKMVQVLGIGKALEVARLVQKADGPVLGFEPKWFRPMMTTLGLGAVFSFFGFGAYDDDTRDPCDGYVCQSTSCGIYPNRYCNNLCYRPNGQSYCQSGGWQCDC